MFEFITDEDERGQVGIGTLIVFIAMVLVAAIAAGVLINTAGFLQERSQQTGEQSTDQVTNRIGVVSSTGGFDAVELDAVDSDTADHDDDEMDQLTLIVKRTPGADTINVSNANVEIIGDGGQSSLAIGSTGGITPTAVAGGDTILSSDSDRVRITVDFDALRNDGDYTPAGTPAQLSAGDELTVRLVSPSGGVSPIEVTVPDPMPEDGSAPV